MEKQILSLERKNAKIIDEHEKKISELIQAFEEEKIKILKPIIAKQRNLFYKAKEEPLGYKCLDMVSVEGKFIRCKDDQIEKMYSISMIGRVLALSPEELDNNSSEITKIQESLSKIEMLENLPTVEQKYWPPKELGGKRHL